MNSFSHVRLLASVIAVLAIPAGCAPELDPQLAQDELIVADDNASLRTTQRAPGDDSVAGGSTGTAADEIAISAEIDDTTTRIDVMRAEMANPEIEPARGDDTDVEVDRVPDVSEGGSSPDDEPGAGSGTATLAQEVRARVRCQFSRFNCSLPNANGNRVINAMRGDEWWPVHGRPSLRNGAGHVRGVLARSSVKINFGQRRVMHGRRYLYAFATYITGVRSSVSGWILESSIVHHNTIGRMPTYRAPNPGQGDRASYRIAGATLSWGHDTFSWLPGHGWAEHYVTRAGNVVNLCYNVPGVGGVATDTVPIGATFHRSNGVRAIELPLYHLGSRTVVRRMTFYYGHVGGRFGWIARAALRAL